MRLPRWFVVTRLLAVAVGLALLALVWGADRRCAARGGLLAVGVLRWVCVPVLSPVAPVGADNRGKVSDDKRQ